MRIADLETPRLIIRELQPGDLDALLRVLQLDHNAPGVQARAARYLAWSELNYAALADLAQPPYGDRAVTLRGSGEMIGLVGLVPALGPFRQLPAFRALEGGRESRRFTAEVGLYWAIDPARRRQGYASEAASALVDFALEALHLRRVIAATTRDNLASIAVMHRLGMQIEENPHADPPWFQVVGVLTAAGE